MTSRILQSRRSGPSFLSAATPNAAELSLTAGSALLTILAFPNFDLWFLVWISLSPLLIVIARAPSVTRAAVTGWMWGVVFFYGSCWWLTYPMIRYGGISPWVAYPLLVLPVMLAALFPALFAAALGQTFRRFGSASMLAAPLLWVAVEWLRYIVTGMLWNALGYSQAFHPRLIQSAAWGGVYAVSFLIITANAGIAFWFIRRTTRSLITSGLLLVCLGGLILASALQSNTRHSGADTQRLTIIAIQPNVPMDLNGDPKQMDALVARHIALSISGLNGLKTHREFGADLLPRLIIWPESPMNFTYARDQKLRQALANFTSTNHTSLLLNSLEPALGGGDQNSAILVNEKGEMSARYDKIRLMPFGEYVPLPQWLPGASSVRGLVGEFKPGSSYTLMPLGAVRAGVFICIEAAHPGIARTFAHEGAEVLINISNDGYLGPTPVMRQHLSNAVFRAVENNRDLLRVTNTGITAYITSTGEVRDETNGFQEATRTWQITRGNNETTFYTRHGDLFVYGCASLSLGFVAASFKRRRVSEARP